MYSRGGPCCQVLIWMRGLFLFWMIPDQIYGTLFLAPFSWNIGILNTIGNRAVHCPGGHLVVTKRSTYIRSQSQNCVNSILGSSGTRICWWHCQKQVIICLSNFQGNLQQNFALIIRITILVILLFHFPRKIFKFKSYCHCIWLSSSLRTSFPQVR